MKRQLLNLVIMFLLILFGHYQAVCQKAESLNALSQQEIADGWTLLFDGKTTNGWRSFKQNGIVGWEVRDGNLIGLGKGGDLGGDIITTEQYEDFEMYFEWAIEEAGNSGVLYRVLEADYPTVYATGPEFQVLDDVGYPSPLDEKQKTGANYAMHVAKDKTLKPSGEFNTSKIIVVNGNVEHWLNGKKIVSYELWTDDWKKRVQESKWKNYPGYGTANKGHISLQDHGSIVKYRNIKIKDLTEKGKPLFNGKNLDGWKIHGTESWYVEDGDLICESGPNKKYGYLATTDIFKDFILRLRFKQEADGNSGVFFRSSIVGTKISGWQVEVAPPGNDSGGIYESYGRGWLWQIPDDRENILLENEWNDLVIKVVGDRVMVWLNNELMTDLTDEKIGKANGVIALQIHDGGGIKVRWKDIYVREL